MNIRRARDWLWRRGNDPNWQLTIFLCPYRVTRSELCGFGALSSEALSYVCPHSVTRSELCGLGVLIIMLSQGRANLISILHLCPHRASPTNSVVSEISYQNKNYKQWENSRWKILACIASPPNNSKKTYKKKVSPQSYAQPTLWPRRKIINVRLIPSFNDIANP